MEQMWMSAWHLADIIKHNEAGIHPKNRGQTWFLNRYNLHTKPHSLDTCLVLIHCIYTVCPRLKQIHDLNSTVISGIQK